MRENKFRAWDKESRRMFNIARFDFADHTVYSHLFACEGYLAENLKIMQYTGLKDKNGTDIYEGDIIECLREGNGFVIKRHGAYGIETRFGFYPFIEVYGKLEIIGNIYENPELLENASN